jgi:hypothetical protein
LPGPVADSDEVRAVGLGDGEERVALEDPDACRLVGQPREALQLGHRDSAEIERPLSLLGKADDHEAESIFARLLVLLDETALLERRKQARRRGLVEAQPAGELGHAGFTLGFAERQ